MRKNFFVLSTFAALVGLGASVAIAQVTIDFATVGNAGNAGDPNNPTSGPLGAVAYEYRIGTFEVTNSQYAAFLNTVAASDPRALFNANMGSDPRGGITRSGSSGSFIYAARPNMGNKPVNFVSSLDALRMANWLTNGQGSGSTESGVYTLSGNTVTAITRDLSNPNQVFLPTENEWYKAALHQPASQGGDTDNFWKFATRSNDFPMVGEIAWSGPSLLSLALAFVAPKMKIAWSGPSLGRSKFGVVMRIGVSQTGRFLSNWWRFISLHQPGQIDASCV